MKARYRSSRVVMLIVILEASLGLIQAHESVSFEFRGYVEFEQRLPVPGFSIGDEFIGTYTFNPLTSGVPNDPLDETLDTEYWAITSWSVTIPTKGISFEGLTGEIAVGNNTFWQQNDRYVVTMFPAADRPQVVAGSQFRFFQIDLFDLGFNGAFLLQDSDLPRVPPNLDLIPDVDRRGRFVFDDASYQNRVTSLTVIPEPSVVALMLTGGALATLGSRRMRR